MYDCEPEREELIYLLMQKMLPQSKALKQLYWIITGHLVIEI